MKTTITLAAAALLCGTSAWAQSTAPTTDEAGTAQAQSQPTAEPTGETSSDAATSGTSGAGTAGQAGAASSTGTSVTGSTSGSGSTTGTSDMSSGAAGASTTGGSTSAAGGVSTGSTATSAGTASTEASAGAGTAGSASLAQFDANNDGGLSPLEFGQMVMSTRATAAGGTGLVAEAKRERYSKASGNGAIKVLNATAREFGMADKNMDKRVDATELSTWQSGGSSGM